MKRFGVFLMLVSLVIFAGCATTDLSVGGHKFAKNPSDLPPGAMVKVISSVGDAVAIGIKGVKVLRVEIYGDYNREEGALTQEGEWMVFRLPKGRWFNLIFLDPTDNAYHFVYVTKEYAKLLPAWMDKSITVTQGRGGLAMTAREFVTE